MIKIVITCDVDLNDRAAASIHVMELFNNLRKISEVYLFVPKFKQTKIDLFNIKYTRRPDIPIIGTIPYQIALFFNLYSCCKKLRIDAIYKRMSDFTLSPLVISKLFGIPYFVEVNGILMDEMKMTRMSKLNIFIIKVSEYLNYKHAQKIVTVAHGIKDGIIKLYNIPVQKIIVIENGANIELFKPMDKEEVKKELKLDPNTRYVCFVGNLAPWQGVEYLIRSSKSIIREVPNTRFLIVGDGLMKNELVELSKKIGVFNNFIFTGAIPYKEIPNYINASDVCLAPFIRKRNASPLKLYEYMACGKPVVASDIIGVGDLLERENAGIAVTPENPEELAAAVLKLLRNKKSRDEMGRNGKEYVIKNNSWESVAKKLVEVFKESINEEG